MTVETLSLSLSLETPFNTLEYREGNTANSTVGDAERDDVGARRVRSALCAVESVFFSKEISCQERERERAQAELRAHFAKLFCDGDATNAELASLRRVPEREREGGSFVVFHKCPTESRVVERGFLRRSALRFSCRSKKP